jgi:hypothetical protein
MGEGMKTRNKLGAARRAREGRRREKRLEGLNECDTIGGRD